MRLIDCFIPAMAFIRHFQSQPAGDIASVRPQLDSLLMQASDAARAAGVTDADVQNALFAVAAWMDEVLIVATWSGAREWARQLLQKRHFNVSNAGDAFFTRLELLRPEQTEVREVYVYCLSLGFAGRFGYDRNAKALADIKQANVLLVQRAVQTQRDGTGLSSEMAQFMFPDAYALNSAADASTQAQRAGRWRWKFSSLTLNALLIPLIVLCVLYGIYHVIIWQMVNALLVQIK